MFGIHSSETGYTALSIVNNQAIQPAFKRVWMAHFVDQIDKEWYNIFTLLRGKLKKEEMI